MHVKRAVRRTHILITMSLFFLIGLGLARISAISWRLIYLPVVLLIICAITGRNKGVALMACLLFLCAGWLRGTQYIRFVKQYEKVVGTIVSIEATATSDAVYGKTGQLEFAAGSMQLVSPYSQPLVGEIDISGRSTTVGRGDRIIATGKLFRKRGGQIVGMNFADITVVSIGRSPIDTFRRQFAAGMQNVLPEPLASFSLGLLIGQRTTLDSQLEDDLVTVGLIHIVAVSGYNLTILILAVRKFFRRGSRFQMVIYSLTLILVFVLITGFSPSIVRAAIVSSLSLVAWYFGRTFKPVLLLVFVAALTAGWNPLYLWSNIGWYLSFTAFFGVLVLGPLLQQRYIPLHLREALLPSVMCETVAAQVCTLPILLFIFGRLSLISFAANVLVVPLTPLAMLLSFLAGLAGMEGFVFAGAFAWPAGVILQYMLSVSTILAGLPYASIDAPISIITMIVSYAAILAWIAVMHMQITRKSAIITETEESKSYVRTQQMVNN